MPRIMCRALIIHAGSITKHVIKRVQGFMDLLSWCWMEAPTVANIMFVYTCHSITVAVFCFKSWRQWCSWVRGWFPYGGNQVYWTLLNYSTYRWPTICFCKCQLIWIGCYNPCRVVAPAPRSGCGEYRNDYWSLKVFPLMAVLCDFAPERSPGPAPPPRQSSVLFPTICSPHSSSTVPLSPSILPFIWATFHLHCSHLLQWPGLVLCSDS